MILLHAELPHQLYITMNSASTHVLSPGDSWSGRRLSGMWEGCVWWNMPRDSRLSLCFGGIICRTNLEFRWWDTAYTRCVNTSSFRRYRKILFPAWNPLDGHYYLSIPVITPPLKRLDTSWATIVGQTEFAVNTQTYDLSFVLRT